MPARGLHCVFTCAIARRQTVVRELARAPRAREPAARVAASARARSGRRRAACPSRNFIASPVLPDHPRALARASMRSKVILSLNVSIACQKPVCRYVASSRFSIRRAKGCSTSSSPSFDVVEDLLAQREEAAVDHELRRRASARSPSRSRPPPPRRSGSSATTAPTRSSRRPSCARSRRSVSSSGRSDRPSA